MARFFKKLYTLQKETLDDDYLELDKKKIGNNVGVKLITNLKCDCGNIKTTGFKHPNGEEVDGTVEPEFKIKDYDLTVKGKLQTSNRFESTVSLNDYITKGTTFFLTGKCEVLAVGNKSSVEVGFDYLNKDYGSLNLKLISPTTFNTDDIELYAAGVASTQGISGGADVQLKPSSQDVSKWNAYLQYDDADNSVAAFGKYEKKDKDNKTRVAGIGVYRNVDARTKGALELSVDTFDTSKTTLKAGINYKGDDSSSVKGKVSVFGTNQFRLGTVYKQSLSTSAKLTFATDLNLNSLFSESETKKKDNLIGNQFGVSLSFFD